MENGGGVKSKRWVAKALVAVLLCTGIGVGVLDTLSLTRLLQTQLDAFLVRQGIPARVTITQANWRGVVAEKLSVGKAEAISIGTVRMNAQPRKILAGDLGEIVIERPVIALVKGKQGWAVEGLEGFTPAPEPSDTPSKPFAYMPREGLAIEHGELHLRDGKTTWLVPISLTLKPEGPGYRLKAAVAFYQNDRTFVADMTIEGLIAFPDDETITLSAVLNDSSKALALAMELRYTLPTRHMASTFTLQPLVFAPEGLQPGALVPPLASTLMNVEGTVSGKGALSLHEGVLKSEAQVAISKLGFQSGENRVRGVEGALVFSSLTPPVTRGEQVLTISEITAGGQTLKDGKIALQTTPSGVVNIASAECRWGDGKISAGPLTIDPAALHSISTTVRVDGIPIQDVVTLVLKQPVEASGTLRGQVPVTYRENVLSVTNGVLESVGPGFIRYRAPADSPLRQTPDAGAKLLLQVIENLEYKQLRLKLDSESAVSMLSALEIDGNNPQLYGGKAIELNVNLRGNLWELLQYGLGVSQLPETLQKRMAK